MTARVLPALTIGTGRSRYRLNDDGTVDEDNGDEQWRPITDGISPTSCWCGFAVVPRSEASGGWTKVYTCRTCRGLNGPNPRLAAT